MDIIFLRSAFTVVSMALFLGIVFWAWSRSNQQDFQEAAQLPFNEESSK